MKKRLSITTLFRLLPVSLVGLFIFPSQVQADAIGVINQPPGVNLEPSSFLNSVVGIFIAIAGLLFFFLLLWGGIRYMVAGGDPKNAESARKVITSAVIGLLIVVGAYFITTFLGNILGIDFLNPNIPGL